MMLYPPMSELAAKAGSRYLLVNLVARRARNIAAAAQAAADDYLHSVQASLADTNATAANTLSQARSEAKRILEQAQADGRLQVVHKE